MKHIDLLIEIAIISAISTNAIAQFSVESIVPKPRQAYVRAIYSGIFSIRNDTKIYLDPDNPSLRQAAEFNMMLKARGIDTCEYAYLASGDTIVSGIVLGLGTKAINKLFATIPDQKLSVSPGYPGREGYIIDVLPMQAIIAGSDEAGLHYGIITFFQLLNNINMNNHVFACRIVDAPEMPNRWVYYSTNIYVGSNVNQAKSIWDSAASLKLNGINLNDVKFNFINTLQPRYVDSLKSLVRFANDKYLKIIPGIMPFGYSNSLLFWDPNYASGLPVRSQKFVIEADTARLVPQVNVQLPNGGFEIYTGNNFSGFRFIDGSGQISFVDSSVFYSGKASIRFDNFAQYPQNTNARVCYRTPVKPFTYYHATAYVKSENISPAGEFNFIALNTKGKNYSYATVSLPATTNGWKRFDICFNSLESDTISIYWGVWGVKSGKFWLDDLALEEVAFINMIRRPGAPLTVSHPLLDIAYIEGVDFDTLRDRKTGYVQTWAGEYDTYHQPPTFRIKSGGNIHNGDTLIMSYYHAITIYDGQVTATMSEPLLYNILDYQTGLLDSIVKPDTYFFQHDEIRTMNWDYGDLSRSIKPSQILADNFTKCVDIVRKHNPGADIWVWSDMFDLYHNAVLKDYYLVNGDLTGSADLIPKEIGIVNWNSQTDKVSNSLNFFESKGFRQISAPFYDKDENQIRTWKQWTRPTKDFLGMMYTTWQRKYTHLVPFAEYAWNHAPYIYHYPPLAINQQGDNAFQVKIVGDKWDSDWHPAEVYFYYRFKSMDKFLAMPLQVTDQMEFSTNVVLTSQFDWIQYYFVAKDSRGWTTRIPFGDTVYFELGELPVSVEPGNNGLNSINMSVIPNPCRCDEGAVLEFDAVSIKPGRIKITLVNTLGIKVGSYEIDDCQPGSCRLKLDFSSLPTGVYFVRLTGLTSDFGCEIVKLICR